MDNCWNQWMNVELDRIKKDSGEDEIAAKAGRRRGKKALLID